MEDKIATYFLKVTIVDGGAKNEVGIGLVDQEYSMEKHPGWEELSYGYHGIYLLIIIILVVYCLS